MGSEMSLPKMHCTPLWQQAKQQAVNNSVSYFSAWAGSKAFQSPLKRCFQSIRIGSVGRDKREVPRRLCGVIIHTEQAGSSAKPIGNVRTPQCQRSKPWGP